MLSLRLVRFLPAFFWCISLLFGLAQAWLGRYMMTPDGIQYLDIGTSGVSTYWSLLYPWLVGSVLNVVRPSMRWEFPVVHAVNFLLFVVALGAFQFLLSTVRKRALLPPVADCCLMAVGYSAFLYTTLDFANLGLVTPDLLVAAFAYLAGALLLRIQGAPERVWPYVFLGLTLGAGYLAKSAFLPLAVVVVGLAATLGGPWRAALAAVAVLVIGGPYIAMMSSSKGRLTTGDSAKLNIIWMVNGVRVTHAQEGAIHPTRKLSERPEIYEFAKPIGGTYPPWFNPVYWNEGIGVRLALTEFVAALREGLKRYVYWFHRRQTIMIAGLLMLLLMIPVRTWWKEVWRDWRFLALAAFPFLMYAFVTVEARYVQPFFAMLWTGLFAAALQASSREIPPRVIASVAGVVAVLTLFEAANSIRPEGAPDVSLQVAEQMKALGAEAGDPVAIGGDESYIWAHLARVRVVSEVFFSPRGPYEQEWRKAREILPSTGAKFFVSSAVPGVVDQDGWTALGNTRFFAYKISRP